MQNQASYITFLTRLADNNLILGHRLSEWCGHGPELEQDIALINVALDLIGQSRFLYQKIGDLEQKTEDQIAYFRDAGQFYNLLLCELPNEHFGTTILRQYLYDQFHYLVLEQLISSSDEFLVSYAKKSIKEVEYHVMQSKAWVIRLGDGTEKSHQKIKASLDKLWPYTDEFFMMDSVEDPLLEAEKIKKQWLVKVNQTLSEATLEAPEQTWPQKGGKWGKHTEHLGFILADMQFLQRAYPDAKAW